MLKSVRILPLIVAVVIQYSLSSIVFAADLSEGMKSLNLGINKQEALKILENQELQSGGIFAPVCKQNVLGEQCSLWVSNLTYGKIPLLNWMVNFDNNGRLASVLLSLSKAGCNGVNGGATARAQFDSLSALLEMQYGKPTASFQAGNRIVWVDEALKAGLFIEIDSEPVAGSAHPGCPMTVVALISIEFMEKFNKLDFQKGVKENDL